MPDIYAGAQNIFVDGSHLAWNCSQFLYMYRNRYTDFLEEIGTLKVTAQMNKRGYRDSGMEVIQVTLLITQESCNHDPSLLSPYVTEPYGNKQRNKQTNKINCI